jgi:hypothetical protein
MQQTNNKNNKINFGYFYKMITSILMESTKDYFALSESLLSKVFLPCVGVLYSGGFLRGSGDSDGFGSLGLFASEVI